MKKLFYHVSDKWKEPYLMVAPKTGRRDSTEEFDNKPCICVTPSIPQALIAVGDLRCYDNTRIYFTETEKAEPAKHVFDFKVTNEHRIYDKTKFMFVRIFELNVQLNELLEKYPLCGYKDEKILKNMKKIIKYLETIY